MALPWASDTIRAAPDSSTSAIAELVVPKSIPTAYDPLAATLTATVLRLRAPTLITTDAMGVLAVRCVAQGDEDGREQQRMGACMHAPLMTADAIVKRGGALRSTTSMLQCA